MINIDQVMRGIALIQGLKTNLPRDDYHIGKRWVEEFHRALEKIENSSNIDLKEFKLSPDDVKRIEVSHNGMTGETQYSNEPFCETALLLQKADSAIGYLQMLLSKPESKPREIGFKNNG